MSDKISSFISNAGLLLFQMKAIEEVRYKYEPLSFLHFFQILPHEGYDDNETQTLIDRLYDEFEELSIEQDICFTTSESSVDFSQPNLVWKDLFQAMLPQPEEAICGMYDDQFLTPFFKVFDFEFKSKANKFGVFANAYCAQFNEETNPFKSIYLSDLYKYDSEDFQSHVVDNIKSSYSLFYQITDLPPLSLNEQRTDYYPRANQNEIVIRLPYSTK